MTPTNSTKAAPTNLVTLTGMCVLRREGQDVQLELLSWVDILWAVNKINLEGDPSADLTINCDSETFRVHRDFLCSKSPVFSVMLNCDMREAREGEINIKSMNFNTLSSMIHFLYTGELAEGWQDLDCLGLELRGVN